jgi:hypothetical protein
MDAVPSTGLEAEMKQRLSIVLSATALAVAVAGAAPVAHAAHEEYVPFVTDFPKPAKPLPPIERPTPEASASGVDWDEVGFVSGGAALAALLAGSGLALARRARLARS